MIDHGKKNLLGVEIDAVDYEAATERFLSAASKSIRYNTTALAVHGVMTGVQDVVHRYRLNQFDMIVPDGMPVRWGLNLLHGTKLPDRVYGPNLMLKICEGAALRGFPIFLFGTDQKTLDLLQIRLKEQFPALLIAGAEPSKFRKLTDIETDDLVDRIRESGAKLAFAGLGCPRQEVWAYEMGDRLKMPVFAVGAAFPFHAGTLPQAPRWMQSWGLEWLYRLLSEPKRLWRRYVYLNPAYLFLLALQFAKLKSFHRGADVPAVPRQNFG
ncbi:MAG: WecB/TagA/CpsF family glycosyltransferase [Pirellula sp.]|jgi:exopolysaccharide biosynthesis WecB/TagA/CpsF family protein|nr:WecB/TagA/CpsF family glycosyltransferase [Pirellula sp.]